LQSDTEKAQVGDRQNVHQRGCAPSLRTSELRSDGAQRVLDLGAEQEGDRDDDPSDSGRHQRVLHRGCPLFISDEPSDVRDQVASLYRCPRRTARPGRRLAPADRDVVLDARWSDVRGDVAERVVDLVAEQPDDRDDDARYGRCHQGVFERRRTFLVLEQLDQVLEH